MEVPDEIPTSALSRAAISGSDRKAAITNYTQAPVFCVTHGYGDITCYTFCYINLVGMAVGPCLPIPKELQ